MGDFDLGAILNSLSPEDMENIKKVASDFLGNNTVGAEKPQGTEKPPSVGKVPSLDVLQGLGLPDLSQLTAILPVLQEINKPDERLEFIGALKPLLSHQRQQRADEAVKLVRLMSILPLLHERGLM